VPPAVTVAFEELPEVTPTMKSSPAPDMVVFCGLLVALSVKVSEPVRFPLAVGANVTLTEQLAPAARLAPQLFVSPKSPVVAIAEMDSAALPLLVSVTFCAALVVPTS